MRLLSTPGVLFPSGFDRQENRWATSSLGLDLNIPVTDFWDGLREDRKVLPFRPVHYSFILPWSFWLAEFGLWWCSQPIYRDFVPIVWNLSKAPRIFACADAIFLFRVILLLGRVQFQRYCSRQLISAFNWPLSFCVIDCFGLPSTWLRGSSPTTTQVLHIFVWSISCFLCLLWTFLQTFLSFSASTLQLALLLSSPSQFAFEWPE
jgi:hypothetical protein